MTRSGRDTRRDSALAVLVWMELGNSLVMTARMLRGILLHAPLSLGRGLWKGLAVAVIAIWFLCGFSIILIVSFVLAMLQSTMSSARSAPLLKAEDLLDPGPMIGSPCDE